MPSASDRFQIVTHPVSPGQCRVCGVPFGVRPLLDTGFDFDFCNREHVVGEIDTTDMGVVYFCDECVLAMAQVFGCLTPDEAQVLKRENAEYENKDREQTKQILGLKDVVHGYHILTGVDPAVTAIDGAHARTAKFEENAAAETGIGL